MAKIKPVNGLRVEIFSCTLRKNTTRPLIGLIGGTDVERSRCFGWAVMLQYEIDLVCLWGDKVNKIIYWVVDRLRMILKYKVSVFYIFTVLLSGLFLLLQTFVLPNSRLTLMQLAPGIITIIMVKLASKKIGLISFLKQCVQKKTAWRWIILSAIIPAVMVFGCDFTFRVLAKQSFDSYSSSAVTWNIWFVIAVIIGCIGEEIGWRGYLLPLFSKKYSLLLSSVLVGAMWGIWHFQFGEGFGFVLFIVTTIEMSIIITWLYYKGNQNLIAAVIFHVMFNYCSQYLHGNVFNIYLRLLQMLLFGIFAAIIYFISPIFKAEQVCS